MRRPLIAACAALIVVAVAGCGSKKAPAGGTTGPGGTVATSNTALTYLDSNELMVGWDPSTSYSNEISVMSNMYERLLRYDPTTKKRVPDLAQSVASSNGGKTWTFTLRPGVKFHTGRAVDAAAAKASIERTIKLNQGAAYEWAPVKSISTPSPLTLVLKLKYSAPMDAVASSSYGAYIFDTQAAPAAKLADWFAAGHESGSGPYEIEQWNKGADVEVRLKQFPRYWRGWKGAHYAHVVFRHVPQATTQAQLLRSGDATFARQLNPQLFASVKSAPGMTSQVSPSFENLIGLLNTQSGPLKDIRLRRAVIAAMDYSGLVNALKGAGVEAHGFIPDGMIGYDANIAEKQDLATATSLLKQAGYGPGGKHLKLTLTYAQGDDNESVTAAILKSDLAPLNVEVQTTALQWTAQWSKAKSSNASQHQDIFVMYWYPDYADAYSWFTSLFRSSPQPSFNLSYMKDSALDKQIDALQQQAAAGPSVAVPAYTAAQQAVLKDALVMTFFVNTYQRPYRSSLVGFQENPAYANVVFAYDVHPGSGT